MESIKVRCKVCNVEIQNNSSKTVTCGCSNMTSIRGDKISAVNLSDVILLSDIAKNKNNQFLTKEDIAWQESRKKRKIKKLDFEIR